MQHADHNAPYGWIPGRERNLAFRTVTDCALYRRNISLSCRQCRHVRVFDGRCLWWLFERRRWNDELKGIGRRFWCSDCQMAKARKVRDPTLTITEDTPTGAVLPWPSDRDWKRLVSRYRS